MPTKKKKEDNVIDLPVPVATNPLDLPMEQFASALDRREANRKALLSWIKKNLIEEIDFGSIHIARDCQDNYNCTNPRHFSKPSLWKPGAEKICGMLGLIPRFPNHGEYERTAFEGRKIEFVILKCELHTPTGFVSAEGIGARSLAKDRGDINKALKMAEKSAHIDACLRVAGLSEIFTQDLEDMRFDSQEQKPKTERITSGQTGQIKKLIQSNVFSNDERKKAIAFADNPGNSKASASEFLDNIRALMKERRKAAKEILEKEKSENEEARLKEEAEIRAEKEKRPESEKRKKNHNQS